MNARFLAFFFVLVASLRADVGTYVTFKNSSAADVDIVIYVDGVESDLVTVYAGTTNSVHYVTSSGFMATFKRRTFGANPSGASWLYDGGLGVGEQVVHETPLSEGGGSGPGPLVEVGGPVAPIPDYKKPLWVTTDGTLTAELFREGVDIIAAAASSGSSGASTSSGGLPTISAGDQSTETAGVGTLTGSASTVSATLKGNFDPGATNSGSLAGYTRNLTLSFGSFTILGTVFHLEPYTYFPWLETAGDYMHDTALVFAVLCWFMFARRRLEEYLIATFQTPQLTTKSGPGQNYVPGLGLAKQVATVGVWVTALLAAVAAVIVLINSNLGTLIPGLNVAGVTGKGSLILNAIAADTNFQVPVEFMSAFFPFAGLFQLLVIHVVYTWTLPGLFALGLVLSKTVHA